MTTQNPQPYRKGSKEFAMFGEYYRLLEEYSIPPIPSEDISQAFVDAWWKEAHDKYVAFGEKYGRFASDLAVAALNELELISKELEEADKSR